MTPDATLVDTVARATRYLHTLFAIDPLTRLAALRPLDADFDRLFVPAAAAGARAGYAGLWAAPPPWPGAPDQTELHVGGAWSTDLVTGSERARPFPGGYGSILASLQPGVVWMVWEIVAPGQRDGISFDGLVAVDDRFIWCPKPWRVVPAAE